MSTIKTWQERIKPEYHNVAAIRCGHMQAEITELREALKAAHENHRECVKCLGEALQESTDISLERDALQAKLSAIEAQPVSELVEALERIANHRTTDTYWASGIARDALANAKAAQPLTKEQVEKVLKVLQSPSSNPEIRHAFNLEAIEIMKGVD